MMVKTNFDNFYGDIKWFQDFLSSSEIKLHNSSPTKKALNELKLYADYSSGKKTKLEENDDLFRTKSRRAFGIASQIWALKKCSEEAKKLILKRVRIYKSSEINLLSNEDSTLNRNFAWEIVSLCCLSHFCNQISFSEPDIIADYNSTRFGFSCKVLYSDNFLRNSETILDGVNQLENSQAEFGFVLVNLSNKIPHDDFFIKNSDGEFFSYQSPEDAMSLFHEKLLSVHQNIEKLDPHYNNKIVFDQKREIERKKTLGIIYYGQTLALVQNRPMLLSNAILHLRKSDNNLLNTKAQEFSKKFNIAAYQMMFADYLDPNTINDRR